MPTPFLNYYSEFDPEATIACLKCGSSQRAGDNHELDGGVFDVRCVQCEHRMVTVMFPTVLETRDAAASGNLRAIEDLPGIEAQAARREITMATMLKSPSQLPELPDSPLVIHWDSETVEGEEWQVLRHGDTEIWREAAFYESIEIFEAVVRVLQARYGSRFAELRPTEASLLWLYGDRLTAGDTVKRLNEAVRLAQAASRSGA